MKKFLISALALATCLTYGSCRAISADLFRPPLEMPGVAVAEHNWTGFYAGVHGGYAWGSADQYQTTGGMPPGPFSYDVDGAFGGGTAGWNWQIKNFVVGVEGDIGYMDLAGSGRIASSVPTKYQALELDGGVYGDVTARAGLAFGRTLVYGKGGFAFYDGEATQTTTNPGFVTHGTDTFTGWVAGGGIEHFITPNISLKVEYLHFDFGSQGGDQTSISDDPVGYVYKNKTDLTADTVKAGLNIHF
jgi:outer membrane immunogenic protein